MLKVIVLFLFYWTIISGQSPDSFKDTSTSSFHEYIEDNGQQVKHIVNTSFQTISIVKDKRSEEFLLKQKIEETFISGYEGSTSKISILAYRKDNNNQYSELFWKIEDTGSDVQIFSDYIRLINYGCCGADNTNIYYSKLSGKKIVSATSDLLFVEVPNTNLKRTISYYSSNSALHNPEFKYTNNLIGYINYCDSEGISQKLFIFSENGELVWTPELKLIDDNKKSETNTLLLWHSNGIDDSSSISKFSLIIKYYDGFEIAVPISNDHFDIQHAVKPESIRLEIKNYKQLEYLNNYEFQNIKSLNLEKLRLLRNEIFARHGHSFESEDLKQYFSEKLWYKEKPGYKISEKELYSEELELINEIKKLEKQQKTLN